MRSDPAAPVARSRTDAKITPGGALTPLMFTVKPCSIARENWDYAHGGCPDRLRARKLEGQIERTEKPAFFAVQVHIAQIHSQVQLVWTRLPRIGLGLRGDTDCGCVQRGLYQLFERGLGAGCCAPKDGDRLRLALIEQREVVLGETLDGAVFVADNDLDFNQARSGAEDLRLGLRGQRGHERQDSQQACFQHGFSLA
jgi:hypothetical protein